MQAPLNPAEQRRAFDFLMGRWRVDNRRLVRRLQGCQDWERFAATQHAQRLPGDIGNFDDFLADDWRPGFVGMSLRVYSPTTGLWSIYWLDNQSGGLNDQGILQAPVVGRFEGDIGVFEGDDQLDGKPIRVRYTWSRTGSANPRWEQAMSADGGKTWETNWVMDFTREA